MIIDGSHTALGGLATGLDTQGIIDRLMQVEARPRVRMEWEHALWGERHDRWKRILADADRLASDAAALAAPDAWLTPEDTEKAVRNWVDSYNALIDRLSDQLDDQRVSRPKTRAEYLSAPLASDMRTYTLYEQLRQLAGEVVAPIASGTGTIDAGVHTNPGRVAASQLASARLGLDEDALRAALALDPTAVRTHMQGVATETRALVGSWRSGGLIDAALDGAGRSERELQQRLEQIDGRLAIRRQHYERMFAKMEELIGRLQGQQSTLTQALGSLA